VRAPFSYAGIITQIAIAVKGKLVKNWIPACVGMTKVRGYDKGARGGQNRAPTNRDSGLVLNRSLALSASVGCAGVGR